MAKNKDIKNLLIYNYGNSCWLKGTISKQNPLTLHHIVPVRDGGPTSITNGALLTLNRHQLFNVTEIYEPDLAEEINYYLKLFHGKYPNLVDERIDKLIDYMYEVNRIHQVKQKIKRR